MLKMVELKAYFLWELEPEPEKKKKPGAGQKCTSPATLVTFVGQVHA